MFIIVGLVCSNLGCYWAPVLTKPPFQRFEDCVQAAGEIHSPGYFQLACELQPEKESGK